MRIEDAYKRHVDLGFQPKWKLPSPTFAQTPSPRHLDAIERITREHKHKVAEIDRKADERIAREQQFRSELLEESRLHKRLLRDEMIARQQADDRVEVASRHSYRHFILELRGSLDEIAQRNLDDELVGQTDDTANPDVRRLDAFLHDVWRDECIDPRLCASDAIANGAASRKGRWIIAPPLKNLRIGVILVHETGHICHPDLDDRREVLAEDRYHRVSVPSEIAAWRWVLDHTPVWTPGMHEDMTRFLCSYKHYAIGTEITAIDALCSRMSYLETRQRIAKEL